jgi:pimeloyl-ACP methyl ester carboxylesterase
MLREFQAAKPRKNRCSFQSCGYSNIKIPVLLLWGDRDWSRPDEREHDRQIVPGAEMATVEDGGHFLPLDRPDAVIDHLLAFQAPLVGKASS